MVEVAVLVEVPAPVREHRELLAESTRRFRDDLADVEAFLFAAVDQDIAGGGNEQRVAAEKSPLAAGALHPTDTVHTDDIRLAFDRASHQERTPLIDSRSGPLGACTGVYVGQHGFVCTVCRCGDSCDAASGLSFAVVITDKQEQ